MLTSLKERGRKSVPQGVECESFTLKTGLLKEWFVVAVIKVGVIQRPAHAVREDAALVLPQPGQTLPDSQRSR